MNNMKKNIKRIFIIYFLLFICAIVCIVKILAFDRPAFVLNSFNNRISITDNKIKRGSIKDINGNILAQTIEAENIRDYPYGREFCHIIGYTTFGKAGLESSTNFILQKLHWQIPQRISSVMWNQPLVANNAITTLDANIQKTAYKALGNNKGAVVIIEPTTGEILAQVSSPNFDPNTITSDWNELNSDAEKSPLLNRATKGLYPPGSTFKIITALALMSSNENWETIKYNCSGKTIIDGKEIKCAGSKVHGEVDIYKAMAVSCNTFFAEEGNKIGAEKLKEEAEKLYFNKELGFLNGYTKSSFSLNEESTISELIETSIGQGKTLATPLHMAMIVAAIANDGVLMKPYILDCEEYYNGKNGNKQMPEMLDILFTKEESEKIKEMLIQVVNDGTGGAASLKGIQTAGKTGTAENSGLDHSWFIGFAPAENPTIAIAVLLENAEGNSKAANIAGEILKSIF